MTTARPPKPFNGGLDPIPDHHPCARGRDSDRDAAERHDMEMSWWPLTGRVLYHHTADVCEPPCPIHKPGEHHMVTWPLHWRNDRDIFERICEHGIGHPDPDSTPAGQSAHGCDGCC